MISILYEAVVKGDEYDVHEDRVHYDEVQDGILNEGRVHEEEVKDRKMNEDEVKLVEVNNGGVHNNKVNEGVMNEGEIFESGDDIDNVIFNYDGALDIEFEESDDTDDFMEENMDKLSDYYHGPQGSKKKNKHKEEFNASEMIVRN